MQRYADQSGGSGVRAFEIAEDSITVCFRNDRDAYRYTYAVPGPTHVEAMKALALDGRGLATYINKHVRQRFAARVPNACRIE